MTSRGIVSRARVPSRGRFLRFVDADDQGFTFRTPEGEDVAGKLDSKSKEDGKTPVTFAMAELKATKKPKIEKIKAESPWVRAHAFNPASGFYFQLHKVKTNYPEEASDEDVEIAVRDQARKSVQDARYVVRGHGRTELTEDNRGNPQGTLFLIPEGAAPDSAAEVASADIYSHVKELQAKHYQRGLSMSLTFTSVNEEGSFVEAKIEVPGVPHDGRPEDSYNVKRPRTPEEFSAYVDQIEAGTTPPSDDFGKVLQAVNESGYDWKVVPTYHMLFATSVRQSYQNKGGLGTTIKDDVAFGRALMQDGVVDVGWKDGKRLTRPEGFAGMSVLGRFGALHDCYTSMEVLLAEDSFMMLPRVEDAIIATSPRTPVKGFVLDEKDVADWHHGVTREVDFSLDALLLGHAPEQTPEHEAEAPENQGGDDADWSPTSSPG